MQTIKEKIFRINNTEEFNLLALEIFLFQYTNNPVYNAYVSMVCGDVSRINDYAQIPFLPIELFRTQKVIKRDEPVQAIFRSSGTTGQERSNHYVCDLSLYEKSAITAFEIFYGSISNYTILALLPSYIEREDSSLIWMIRLFMNLSHYKADCGFYPGNHSELIEKLEVIKSYPGRKILLIGVSFALLDLTEKIDFPLGDAIVMETGGMKGKRKEITREELHEIVCSRMGIPYVHSEYGMTELLSQAYSKGKGIYQSPPWMKILIREMNDPLSLKITERTGGINVIDLANIYSCSFIATQDIGKSHTDDAFEVLGRFDYSETRGCNLMTM